MKYLLDTNVVSEWVKPRPDAGVAGWLAAADEDALHLSVGLIAELRYGIARLAPSRRRSRLDMWLREDLRARFADRILPVTESVAIAWGDIKAERDRLGRPIGAMDALIAATAVVHGLSVVTRNSADFIGSGPEILNPWSER